MRSFCDFTSVNKVLLSSHYYKVVAVLVYVFKISGTLP